MGFAIAHGVSVDAALLYGKIVSWNGSPLWEIRKNIAKVYNRSTRQVSRYLRELVKAGLIVNEPSPIGAILPGRADKPPLPYRPWYRYAVGLPALRALIQKQSRESYEKWAEKFEQSRAECSNRKKLADVVCLAFGKRPKKAVVTDNTPLRSRAGTLDATVEIARAANKPPSDWKGTHAEWIDCVDLKRKVDSDPSAWPPERIEAELLKRANERAALSEIEVPPD